MQGHGHRPMDHLDPLPAGRARCGRRVEPAQTARRGQPPRFHGLDRRRTSADAARPRYSPGAPGRLARPAARSAGAGRAGERPPDACADHFAEQRRAAGLPDAAERIDGRLLLQQRQQPAGLGGNGWIGILQGSDQGRDQVSRAVQNLIGFWRFQQIEAREPREAT